MALLVAGGILTIRYVMMLGQQYCNSNHNS